MKTPQERFHKTTELLAKFKNGENLYKRNAMFNRSIQMMVEGMNEYEVLEQVIIECERLQHQFEDYMNRDTRPITLKDTFH